MAETLITLKCPVCEQEFSRSAAEHNRTTRKGRPFFCSRSCAGRANHTNIPEARRVWTHLDPANRRDEFSAFRVLHRIARKRSLQFNREFSLALENLRDCWTSQNGICIYTGWAMILPETSTEYNRLSREKNPRRASIDRIDSRLGYTRANIQFVTHMANVAKNDYTHEQMNEFCRAIARHHESYL